MSGNTPTADQLRGCSLNDFHDLVQIGGRVVDPSALAAHYSRHGVCSRVFSARFRQSTVALKVMINMTGAQTASQFSGEFELLRNEERLPHRCFIMSVLAVFVADDVSGLPGWDFDPSVVDSRTTVIVMPSLSHDAQRLVTRAQRRPVPGGGGGGSGGSGSGGGGGLDEAVVVMLMWDVLSALVHLYHFRIVHRDVKLDNILVKLATAAVAVAAGAGGDAAEEAGATAMQRPQVAERQVVAGFVITDFGCCVDCEEEAEQGDGASGFGLRVTKNTARGGAAANLSANLSPKVLVPWSRGLIIDYSKADAWSAGLMFHAAMCATAGRLPVPGFGVRGAETFRDEEYLVRIHVLYIV
jgi:serine/threonine protein kinase